MLHGSRVHEGNVNTRKVQFHNSQLPPDPFPSGVSPALELILDDATSAAVCRATSVATRMCGIENTLQRSFVA